MYDFNEKNFLGDYCMHDFKTFEELSTILHDEKFDAMEHIVENIEHLSEFERGYWRGQYDAYDNMYHDVRQKLKHGVIEE